jgi:hypothetical protein
MTTTKKIITGVLSFVMMATLSWIDNAYAMYQAEAWFADWASRTLSTTLQVAADQEKWFTVFVKNYESFPITADVHFVDWYISSTWRRYCTQNYDVQKEFWIYWKIWWNKVFTANLAAWQEVTAQASVTLPSNLVWKHWCLVLSTRDPAVQWQITISTRKLYVVRTSN